MLHAAGYFRGERRSTSIGNGCILWNCAGMLQFTDRVFDVLQPRDAVAVIGQGRSGSYEKDAKSPVRGCKQAFAMAKRRRTRAHTFREVHQIVGIITAPREVERRKGGGKLFAGVC